MRRPNLIWSFAVVLGMLGRYFLYRLGRGSLPVAHDGNYPELTRVFSAALGWERKVRYVADERFPKDLPCIFVGNHMWRDDPFVIFKAVYDATQGRVKTRIMMRDDFFKSMPNLWIFDVDELSMLLGTMQISRENVQLAQLRPFINLLCEGRSFIMFPTRTRTRTGLFAEYRDGLREPGGVSFFAASAQRRNKELKVAVVPVTRTFNHVTGKTALVFGEPRFLGPKASKAEQRSFDHELINALAELVELNVPQVLSTVLYLRCLHQCGDSMELEEFEGQLERIFAGLEGRFVHPAVETDLHGEVLRTLRFLKSKGMVSLAGHKVTLDVNAILAVPEDEKKYGKANMVKRMVNEIIHLPDVVEQIETVTLEAGV